MSLWKNNSRKIKIKQRDQVVNSGQPLAGFVRGCPEFESWAIDQLRSATSGSGLEHIVHQLSSLITCGLVTGNHNEANFSSCQDQINS